MSPTRSSSYWSQKECLCLQVELGPLRRLFTGGCLSVMLCITRSFDEGNQFLWLLCLSPVWGRGEGGGKGGVVCVIHKSYKVM